MNKRNPQAIEKHAHHTIPLDTIETIDWHLRNLWSGGFKVIKDISVIEHHRITGKQNKRHWVVLHGKLVPQSRFTSGIPACVLR